MRSASLLGPFLLASVLFAACADGGENSSPVDAGVDLARADAAPDAGEALDADVPDAPPPDAPSAPVEDPFGPAPAAPSWSESTINTVAAEVRSALSSHSGAKSVRVVNLTTGDVLYEDNADLALIPASNTKLFSTAAALGLFGDDDELATYVYASAAPSSAGVVSGDLYVVGHHDFSASGLFYGAPSDATARLAASLRASGITQVTGRVRVRGEFVFGGSSTGYLNTTTHRQSYASSLGTALTQAGISHGGAVAEADAAAPSSASLVLERSPVALWVGASAINVPSHNEFADLLARRLGAELGGTSTEASGGAQIVSWARETLDVGDTFAMADGSGLSRSNRVSASDMVKLLDYMDGGEGGTSWRRSLAISGVRGTVSSRMTGATVRGRAFVKTGTLSNVIALSGYLEHQQDGQRIAFAMVLNDVSSQSGARAMVDSAVTRLSAARRGSATRPAAPRLLAVRADEDPRVTLVEWQPADSSAQHIVWLSPDCESWDRTAARLTSASSLRIANLTAGTCVRITVLGSDGYESDPSNTYAVTLPRDGARSLVVDVNDRWQSEPSPENTTGEAHAFTARVARALGGSVDTVYRSAVTSGAVDLSDYDVVWWLTGEQSTVHETVSAAEQALLTSYVRAGGGLVVSGAEVGWDLIERGTATDRTFASDVLGVGFVRDSAGTWEVASQTAGIAPFTFHAPDGMTVSYPDVFSAAAGTDVLATYVSSAGGAAVVGKRSAGAVVTAGFPLEAIASPRDLRDVLERIGRYLAGE